MPLTYPLQVGDLIDLYRYYEIDTKAIVDAATQACQMDECPRSM